MADHLICRSDELLDGGKGVRFTVPGVVPSPGPKVSAGGTATAGQIAAQQRASVEQSAFVVRFRGRPQAFLNRCGHVPVELDWQAGDFFDFSGDYLICATHGALYGPESGRCLSGRCAGKGLTPVPVIERNGNIYWQESNEG